jgi:redox-sensitive bicupin YhaK (pirin superfamily)
MTVESTKWRTEEMLQLKPLSDISGVDAGWLKAKHHFAIGPYGNPAHISLGSLIVLNDDEIAPHTGFDLHHHSDLEIISYIREGAVTHRDDQGHSGETRAGDVQVMSAGRGIRHSERNEGDVPLRLFQIWLTPTHPGGTPQWGNKPFPRADRSGVFVPLASGRHATDALPIRTDAEVLGAVLNAGTETNWVLSPEDAAYLVPATGVVEVNGKRVQACEGLTIRDEKSVTIKALETSEVVMVVTAI